MLLKIKYIINLKIKLINFVMDFSYFFNNNLNKMDVKSDNLNIKNAKDNVIFMDIDVDKGMCQGIYFNKKNTALKCTKKAKYCKNNKFMVCEKHKNQCFGN